MQARVEVIKKMLRVIDDYFWIFFMSNWLFLIFNKDNLNCLINLVKN